MNQKIHSMQSHVQVSLMIFISNHSSYLPLLRIDKGSGVESSFGWWNSMQQNDIFYII